MWPRIERLLKRTAADASSEVAPADCPSYVFDPLWGAAAAAVRFKCLSIFGHTNFAVPADELADHYRRLVGHVTAGDIRFEVERVPLDAVADAWRRQAEGAGAKLVVVP